MIGISQKLFDSDEAAFEEVRRGFAWGSMIFQSNYSEALVERTESGRYADDSTLLASDININLDMSSEYDACTGNITNSLTHSSDTHTLRAHVRIRFQINKLARYYSVTFNTPISILSTKF